MEAHRHEIISGELAVFFEDECHLLWGDLCGYVWGKTTERIEVPITNERSKQTYYGAVNLYTQECLIQASEAGNGEGTIAFLNYLLSQCPNSRMALIWDGATYHRSQEVKSTSNQSIESSMSPTGKSLAFALPQMTPSKTQLKIFGCRQSDSFESTTTCVHRSMWLNSFLSL